MDMKIRKFEAGDMRQVLCLCREVREYHRQILDGYFLPQDDCLEETLFRKALENGNFMCFVAAADGDVCGYLLAVHRNAPWLENPEIGYIHNFGVAEMHRGKGTGKMLMDAFYQECKRLGIREIKFGVFNKNKKACRFYETYGFVPQEQKMSLFVK